jgi:hypothetical protein
MKQAGRRASEIQPSFRKNISLQSSWSRSKPSKKAAWSRQQAEPVKVFWRFGGTYSLQLHGGRRSQERHQHEAGFACFLLHVGFLFNFLSIGKLEAIFSSES